MPRSMFSSAPCLRSPEKLKHPLWDSNPQSSDWKSDALSIRPRGLTTSAQMKMLLLQSRQSKCMRELSKSVCENCCLLSVLGMSPERCAERCCVLVQCVLRVHAADPVQLGQSRNAHATCPACTAGWQLAIALLRRGRFFGKVTSEALLRKHQPL